MLLIAGGLLAGTAGIFSYMFKENTRNKAYKRSRALLGQGLAGKVDEETEKFNEMMDSFRFRAGVLGFAGSNPNTLDDIVENRRVNLETRQEERANFAYASLSAKNELAADRNFDNFLTSLIATEIKEFEPKLKSWLNDDPKADIPFAVAGSTPRSTKTGITDNLVNYYAAEENANSFFDQSVTIPGVNLNP